ncbi:hypothetical protein ANANG_G00114750, partial [Anguilla anguilla]
QRGAEREGPAAGGHAAPEGAERGNETAAPQTLQLQDQQRITDPADEDDSDFARVTSSLSERVKFLPTTAD